MIKKIMQCSNDFIYHKTFTYRMLYSKAYHSEEMLNFLKSLDDYLEKKEECKYYKNARNDTTTVARISFKNNLFVIKRYNFRNFWHGLKLQLRRSRGLNSFYFAQMLEKQGISTIKPVAYVERRWGLWKRASYFISMYEEGLPGCIFFKDYSIHKKFWREVIAKLANITTLLQRRNIYHGDYHFGNFLIVNNQPLLLDLDRVKQFRTKNRTFLRLHQKDIKNFKQYLQRNPQAQEYFKETLFQDP